jgi:putative transposase
MSRLRRIEQAHRFFFVTTNVADGVAPLTADERSLTVECRRATRLRNDFLIFAYVIMPEHLHILVYPRNTTLTDVLRNFKSKTAFELRKSGRSEGAVWQPRFFDFVCRRVRDFWSKVEYIRRNPVEAGLAKNSDEWKWSSAAREPLFVADPIQLPADGNTLIWPARWG